MDSQARSLRELKAREPVTAELWMVTVSGSDALWRSFETYMLQRIAQGNQECTTAVQKGELDLAHRAAGEVSCFTRMLSNMRARRTA